MVWMCFKGGEKGEEKSLILGFSGGDFVFFQSTCISRTFALFGAPHRAECGLIQGAAKADLYFDSAVSGSCDPGIH